jgi:hypothetical protein
MKKTITTLLYIVFITTIAQSQQYPDRHNTTKENSWMSCVMTVNPNSAHPNSHWIQYDFGTTYALHQSTFWNVNAYDYLENGINDFNIDYSIDGIIWRSWGRYSLDQASGLSIYEGEPGPDFNGTVARYLLITPSSNHGGSCFGLSEFRVQSSPVTISDVDDVNTLDLAMTASPNPFNEQSSIKINGDLPDGALFYQLYDNAGRLVQHNSFYGNEFVINGQGLTTGIYNVKVVHATGTKSIQINYIN